MILKEKKLNRIDVFTCYKNQNKNQTYIKTTTLRTNLLKLYYIIIIITKSIAKPLKEIELAMSKKMIQTKNYNTLNEE